MSTPGFIPSAAGFIKDQTKLLERLVNGLDVYNSSPDPIIDQFCAPYYNETIKVPQAPLQFEEEGEGTNPDVKKLQRRRLSLPLRTFDLSDAWTRTGLEDSLEEDVLSEMDAAMKGDAERVTGYFFSTLFTKRTAGSIAAAYQASAWNGETDVPSYGENTFGSAHYHYKGLNTTTLTRDHYLEAVEDLTEHGYKGPFVSLHSIAQMSDIQAIMDPSSGTIIGSPDRARAIDQGIYAGGIRVAGVEIQFHEFVPAGYFGVIDKTARPLAKREHLNAKYRGLRVFGPNLETHEPLIDAIFRRRIGFAFRHLGAATFRQIVASATYTNPTMRFA